MFIYLIYAYCALAYIESKRVIVSIHTEKKKKTNESASKLHMRLGDAYKQSHPIKFECIRTYTLNNFVV